MSHPHRFYAPDLPEGAGRVELSKEEAHHALHVLRVREGDDATLFDGAGRWAEGRVCETTKRMVAVDVGAPEQDTESPVRLTLAQAALNHERNQETIVRRGTELGVAAFVFFRGAHSERAPKVRDKWMRHAVESCKQCGRNRLPSFAIAESIDAVLRGNYDHVLVATQAVEPQPIPLAAGDTGSVLLLIGPEGDLSRDEVERVLAAGGAPISLGPYTLRSEVAATVAMALVQYSLGALGPR